MKMNIDLYDFATVEEVKEVALAAVRQLVIQQFSGAEKNLNRLIVNLSYSFVFEMVDQQFDGKLAELLKARIPEIINELSAFHVFRRKDAWGQEESVAYKALQEEMANNRPLIKSRVEQIIQQYPFKELERHAIGEVVYQCVMDRLFAPQESKE